MTVRIDASDYGWLTLVQFADREGISEDWARKLCKAGRLAGAHKSGGVWFIHGDAKLPQGRGKRGVFDPERADAEYQAWVEKKAKVEAKYAQTAKVQGLTDRQKVMAGWIKDGYKMHEGGLRVNPDGSDDGVIAGWNEFDFIFWRANGGRVAT